MIERWQEAREALEELLTLESSERQGRLLEIRGEDPELADIVAKLLAQDDAEGELEPQKPRAELPDRRTVGRFHLRHRMATGRTSSVWSAARADGAFDQEVAIKLIDTGVIAQELGLSPAEVVGHERHLLARVDSPHVVRLIDAGELDGQTEWLAMELLDAEPLTDYGDRRQLGIRQRVELVIQACRAVESCHRAGVLHLDLSPSNVLVTTQGQIKLIDLGSGKRVGDTAAPGPLSEELGASAHGAATFTPSYAAPERFVPESASPRRFGEPADVWSLGALLYESLTGAVPIDIVDLPVTEARRRKVSEEAVAPVRRLRALEDSQGDTVARLRGATAKALQRELAAGGLEAVTLAALRSHPDERTPSARELGDDLERWLAGQPVRARRETFTQRATRFARRSPRVAMILLAIAAALGTGASALWYSARRADRATRQLAALQRVEAERLEAARTTAQKLIQEVYRVIAPEAGTQEALGRLLDAGIEVAESAEDAELHMWLGDALVKRASLRTETARWSAALARSCLADCARAAELVAPIRQANPSHYEAARIAWDAALLSSRAYYNLCDMDRCRGEVARSRALMEGYSPEERDPFSQILWLYAQSRVHLIEGNFEREFGQLRRTLARSSASLEIFERIKARSPHLGIDERSRLHRLRVRELSLRFLDATQRGAAPDEEIPEEALAWLEEARASAEVVLELAEENPTRELLLSRAAEVAEELSHWWRRMGRDEEVREILGRALRIAGAPGTLRRHTALIILAELKTAALDELPPIRESELGPGAAARLFVRHAQVTLDRGDVLGAAGMIARAQALLDSAPRECPDRAETKRLRAELVAIQGRVELIGSKTAAEDARRRYLERAEERFERSLALLDGAGGDDLYVRNLVPVRMGIESQLADCRAQLAR